MWAFTESINLKRVKGRLSDHIISRKRLSFWPMKILVTPKLFLIDLVTDLLCIMHANSITYARIKIVTTNRGV
jgi:hypothetical protein